MNNDNNNNNNNNKKRRSGCAIDASFEFMTEEAAMEFWTRVHDWPAVKDCIVDRERAEIVHLTEASQFSFHSILGIANDMRGELLLVEIHGGRLGDSNEVNS